MQPLPKDINPVWLAQSRLRRRRFDECIETCSTVLDRNSKDQAVWYLKVRALTLKTWIDDTEIEEEGIADILLDENTVAQVARPGTSMARPMTGAAAGGGPSQAVRPMTNSGRPITGFARPNSARPMTGSAKPGTARLGTASLAAALQSRPGTSRPVTSSGRFVRLGTASMACEPGGPFIQLDRIDLSKYASRPLLARCLCDYIIYAEHNVKRALELCAEATTSAEYQDWWWKSRLGKCYYQLGLLRDAEKQFQSSLQLSNMITTSMELAKIYLRMDQPNTALEVFTSGLQANPGDVNLLLGIARVHDALNNTDKGIQYYKTVLNFDASSVEAVACLAAHHFYTDQPEIALRYYRRLLQMGVQNAELWVNIGLCCFYASQYDVCLRCFEKALHLAGDDTLPDIWYNIGQVAIGIGDMALAQQCFRLCISMNPNHPEAQNNLGVLEYRKGNDEQARGHFRSGQTNNEHVFELYYNGSLLAFKLGDFQQSYELVTKALEAYPEHTESQELLKQLKQHFTML
jgi:tetratricopeptide repeat protein 8